MTSSSQLISIKQAATMLGVTPLTLRNWDKNGKLCPMRHPMNNYRVYKRSDIEEILAKMGSSAHRTPPRPPKTTVKLQVQHLED